ncbi:MAG: IclR family transcriptional regulator [Deltaproteobacteria bacterium]|nr:IclR family transcriptional regulator [Deltaproteobacteria bacterium]
MTGLEKEKKVQFKKVPALVKGFKVLELLANSRTPLGVTEITNLLELNKSTVFNIVHTLLELGFLDSSPENKVRLGLKFHDLSRVADPYAVLISKIHPFLEEINRQTRLSVFLGLRSDHKAVIIDKVDSPQGIKVSSEIGMKIPLIAGSHGRALLSHLSDQQLDEILTAHKINPFTAKSCTSLGRIKQEIKKTREERFAYDDEGYLEGIRSLAIPILTGRSDFQSAVWIVGLKSQITDEMIPGYKKLLKQTGAHLEALFSR